MNNFVQEITLVDLLNPPSNFVSEVVDFKSMEGFSIYIYAESGSISGTAQILASNDPRSNPSIPINMTQMTNYFSAFVADSSNNLNNGFMFNVSTANFRKMALSLSGISGTGKLKAIMVVKDE